MTIPLEHGFTVVTGPNGSGKSNILDAVLFCLGLASSRGMRAERLPDLINSAMLRAGKASETVVSVRFDLGDWQPDDAEAGLEPPDEGPWIRPGQTEWSVSRRLRVAPGGTYASSFSADGVPCNLQQLQTQLRRLRVDPEGSNVVMQGDVTRIVSMGAKDRRGIIDELAGVALFDSRIEQTRGKLQEVYDRQERCGIVQQELLTTRQKLERDCSKARTYQDLRQRLQNGRVLEQVLVVEAGRHGLDQLGRRQESLRRQQKDDTEAIQAAEAELHQASAVLEQLQAEVKALGEDQLLAVQAELAGLEARTRERSRQAEKQQHDAETLQNQRHELLRQQSNLRQQQQELAPDTDAAAMEAAEGACRDAEAAVDLSRRRLGEVAGRSGSWLEEQKRRSQERDRLSGAIAPLEAERQQRGERCRQSEERLAELKEEQQRDSASDQQAQGQLETSEQERQSLGTQVAQARGQAQELAESLALQQRTRSRLEQEQGHLERDIARIDSRRETLQESRGTGALRLLLEAGLDGIHGAVAQLGEVEEQHRLALEVAAGGRLAQVVVEDDRIAARAIELLKQRRAGRLTFLPLNKIRGGGGGGGSAAAAMQRGGNPAMAAGGLIGRAVDLIRHEPVYDEVFRYVFGDTLVFGDLATARRELGRCRAVTLDGELLEKSGAMTGGSLQQRSSQLSFGRSQEGDEAEPLRRRLIEVGESLAASRRREAELGQQLESLRPRLEQLQQRQAALEAEHTAALRSLQPQRERQQERSTRLLQLEQSLKTDQQRLQELQRLLDPLQQQLKGLQQAESSAEASGDAARWQGLQQDLEASDRTLAEARLQRDQLLATRRERALAWERVNSQLEALRNDEQRLVAAVETLVAERQRWKEQQQSDQEQQSTLLARQSELQARFGERRRARDAAEAHLAAQRQSLQQKQWDLQRLAEELQTLGEQQRSEQQRLTQLERELPEPLPEVPAEVRENGLEALVAQLRTLQSRMEALEPVNMLALEELEELEGRLADLEERLEVLSKEREELLLRIETVATLRQEAFLEAFTAVDSHFREIFAELSDGEGSRGCHGW